MVDLLPSPLALAPDGCPACAPSGPVGVPEDLDHAGSQQPRRETCEFDDGTVRCCALIAQHHQDALQIPTTTGRPDLYEVGREKVPESGFVGSAGRCLKLPFEFKDAIDRSRRR